MSMHTRTAERASTERGRWRSALAVALVAGLATIGVTAIAAPAVADESEAVIEADTSAVDDAAGDETVGDTPASDSGEAADPVDTGDTSNTSDTGDSADTADSGDTGDSADTGGDAPTVSLMLVPPGDEVVSKVEICHATASYQNPYIVNEPAADGDVSGHAGHIGPIFWPDIPKHTEWGDIIPPFLYDGGGELPSYFPGLNWDAEGQEIYANDCVIPLPDLDVTVTPGDCSTGDDGTVTVLFSGLIVDEEYSYYVEGAEYLVVDTFVADASSEEIVLTDLPPGNFIVYVEWTDGESGPVFDWRGFVIEPCQPEITVEVTECPASGGSGEALLKLSNLVDGVEYEVTVTDRGMADGTRYGGVHTVTADDAGTAQVLVSALPAGRNYTAWIDGLWEAEPWEEPPFVGGGGFTPIESVVLSASVDFSLKPCPVAPVPVKPAALPATGAGGVGGMLAGSMLLLGLGSALLLARRRMTEVRDVS